jgi:FixJ family two-component response regulator
VSTPAPVVFVVDDDAAVRRSLARLLGSAGLRAETFASAQEFLARPEADGPACLVLDVRMPGLSGLDLQERLGSRVGVLPIVFMTGHGTVPMSVRAMKAGASDFLQKPFDDQALLDAVEGALDRSRAARERRGRRNEVLARLETLTPREREVFDGVVRGLLNKQIAAELGSAEKTVKIHRGRVMQKMDAGSVADLVRMDALAREP